VDWTHLSQGYDGDGLRVSRSEDGTYPARYLRSTVLGGQVVAEIDYVNGVWSWGKGYVYAGQQLLAVQQNGVYFVHEDPFTKSKRVTDIYGTTQSAVELDPYGADAGVYNTAFQPRKFTSYERDPNGTDEAMARRYNRWHSRFDQPDPYEGSYDFTNPQSFNRYAYTKGDPVNLADPTGLVELTPCYLSPGCRYHGFDDGWEPYNADDRGFPGFRNPHDNNGGGSIAHGNPPSARPRTLLEKLRKCVHDLYGIELVSFSAASHKKKGVFVGTGFDSSLGREAEIRVTTDAYTFNTVDLNSFYDGFVAEHPEWRHRGPGEGAAGLTLPNSMVLYSRNGPREGFSPYLNFVSTDIKDAYVEKIQIHELGHALALIRYGTPQTAEDGKALEDCIKSS
jgi:RHS repeat-associated protein